MWRLLKKCFGSIRDTWNWCLGNPDIDDSNFLATQRSSSSSDFSNIISNLGRTESAPAILSSNPEPFDDDSNLTQNNATSSTRQPSSQTQSFQALPPYEEKETDKLKKFKLN